jgi:hypothetical protein
MKTIIFFTTFLSLSSPYSLANECWFIEAIDALVKMGPEQALNEHVFGNPASFLSVVDGISPSTPGIGEEEETACVKSNYELATIWAGGDVDICDRQSEVAGKAYKFASEYNSLLRKNLVSNKTYLCTEDLLAKERKRRCDETGKQFCTGREDWSGAHSELSRFVWNLNSTATVGYLPEKYGQFWVSIRDPMHRKEIQEKSCELFPKYGIKMDVTIYIELANFNNELRKWEKEKMESVICRY